MIDIHSHLLPNVDDGSDDVAISLELLEQACQQGVTDMILTPHFIGGAKNEINLFEKFNLFKEQVSKSGININLYLGREVYIDKDYKNIIKQEPFVSLNGTRYVLIEFDDDKVCDILNVVYELVRIGYVPIVAHVERYTYLNLDDIYDIKDTGGLIQVNALDIVGRYSSKRKKFINTLLKHCLVDFVSSDAHSGREYVMKKACEKVLKKHGEDAVSAVFYDNAQNIIKGQS